MGGQACVLYGAAEFSRDTDFAVLCEPRNLERLGAALVELQAKNIAVPPFEADYLLRGHAVHFRCGHPDAANLRVDVMSVMRGVAPVRELWERRTTVLSANDEEIELLSLPDLVRAKKTQRDKDWPMLRRLVDANYFANREAPTAAHIEFWLRELRTPELLREVAQAFPLETTQLTVERNVLDALAQDDETALIVALEAEEKCERIADRAYWQPLRAELEQLRRQIRRS